LIDFSAQMLIDAIGDPKLLKGLNPSVWMRILLSTYLSTLRWMA
jgi:hypothetical protein